MVVIRNDFQLKYSLFFLWHYPPVQLTLVFYPKGLTGFFRFHRRLFLFLDFFCCSLLCHYFGMNLSHFVYFFRFLILLLVILSTLVRTFFYYLLNFFHDLIFFLLNAAFDRYHLWKINAHLKVLISDLCCFALFFSSNPYLIEIAY